MDTTLAVFFNQLIEGVLELEAASVRRINSKPHLTSNIVIEVVHID